MRSGLRPRPAAPAGSSARRAPPGLRRLARWCGCDGGASAVEFALVAPILAFLLLAGVDMGLAISERMAMDHALRAGAQAAIPDPGEAQVLEVIERTAEKNFTLADGTNNPDAINLSATRFCACPESVGVAVACSTICTGSKPTFIYYRMTGQKTHTGWIVPDFSFGRNMQVQIR